ncbi:MAG: hypothetical protein WBD38_00495 [Candidatus Dormiibacterota bacterium]
MAILALALSPVLGVTGQSPNVLLVGPAGTPGAQYDSIQAAVNAAQPADWVLVAPGVYHEKGYSPTSNPNGKPPPAEVFITTPNLHLRGMNRDTVIVDGTNLSASQAAGTLPAGSPACSGDAALQDPGVHQNGGGTQTREGILVFKTSGTSIENLTSCNSLSNEIWWNNGDGSGIQTPMSAFADYISATSTFYKDSNTRSAQYGIFTSDVEGPVLIDHSYANNMTDSSYYVGACRNCNTILERPHAENSALGLSSTNAGGNLIVENGEWDLNRTGLVSNAQNNDDWPSPELGQCVPPSVPPTGAGPNSCYVIRHNKIHDNNNPNTPGSGLTSVSAVGTGVELAATQHISVVENQIYNQGAWGVVTHDFPDPETGTGTSECGGGVYNSTTGICIWFSRGNWTANNHFQNNGGFNNPSNGDVANQATGALDASACPRGNDTSGNNGSPCAPSALNADPNCFSGDQNPGGLKADPPTLESLPCATLNSDTTNTVQLLCATGALSLFAQGTGLNPPSCTVPNVANYPVHSATADTCAAPALPTPAGVDPTVAVCFLPLSYTVSAAVSPPMPDPCAGVPVNAYCPAASTTTSLPNSAALRSLLAPALIGGLGAAGLAVLAVSARRRRRTTPG